MSSSLATDVSTLIRTRRSIFPKSYIDRPIPREIIEEVLENANWAPNHRKTEPWRFQVFTGEALHELGEYLSGWYKENVPPEKYSEKKFEKNLTNPQRSGCVIAICMQRDPEERVPEWEELAAVSCAVQNMWLTCTAHNIGAYWSSPRSILNASEWLGLPAGQRCLGLFYMGYHEIPEFPGKRGPITDKVTWR